MNNECLLKIGQFLIIALFFQTINIPAPVMANNSVDVGLGFSWENKEILNDPFEEPHYQGIVDDELSNRKDSSSFLDISVRDADYFLWEVESVDAPKYILDMTNSYVAYDSYGNPHLAYGSDHLYYAYRSGSSWYLETVDSSPGVGSYASIALDKNDKPHISYFDKINEDLKYAVRNNGIWGVEIVDDQDAGYNTAIAVDDYGNPHISYYGSGYLKYAKYVNNDWEKQFIENCGGAGSDSNSIMLDKQGHPHISYMNWLEEPLLKYAWYSGSNWSTEIVYPGFTISFSFSLSGEDIPHFVYSTFEGIKYNHKSSIGWKEEHVSNDSAYRVSLKMDSNDRPHLAYGIRFTLELIYAYYSADHWEFQEVEVKDKYAGYIALVLDNYNVPSIAYYAWESGDLIYSSWFESVWIIERVDNAKDVGRYNSLAIDSNGYAHIAYYARYGGHDLLYAWEEPDGWYYEVVDSNGKVGNLASLTLDIHGYPHIVYYVDLEYKIRHAWKDHNGWQFENIGSASYSNINIKIDPNNVIHISFRGIDGELMYGNKKDNRWYLEAIADNGEYSSLALDSLGFPHISYADKPAQKVIYAWKDNYGWNFRDVEAFFADTSLALDNNGTPHISYYGICYLHYATWDGDEWNKEIILDIRGSGDHTIALDHNGHPLIGYYGGTWPGHLILKRWNGNQWINQTIDKNVGGSWGDLSLTIDKLGNLFISYYDNPNGDLKMAWGTIYREDFEYKVYLPQVVD
jgi:hypothetical protein